MKNWKLEIETRNRFCSSTGAPLKPEITRWVTDDSGRNIALLCTSGFNQADADLIVAAPKLLEAALDAYRTISNSASWADVVRVREVLERAINEAEPHVAKAIAQEACL